MAYVFSDVQTCDLAERVNKVHVVCDGRPGMVSRIASPVVLNNTPDGDVINSRVIENLQYRGGTGDNKCLKVSVSTNNDAVNHVSRGGGKKRADQLLVETQSLGKSGDGFQSDAATALSSLPNTTRALSIVFTTRRCRC